MDLVYPKTNLTLLEAQSNVTNLNDLPLNRSERSISEWSTQDMDATIIEFGSDCKYGMLLINTQLSIDIFPLPFTDSPHRRSPRNIISDQSILDRDDTVSKVLIPQTVAKSEKADELNADFIQDVSGEWFVYVWNDIHWLASAIVAMTVAGFMFNHHAFCRQMIVGAQMRIALCSLVYRKVTPFFVCYFCVVLIIIVTF